MRELTGLDTLAASRLLGKLRDRRMLELRGGGSASYYTLVGRAERDLDVDDSKESITDRRELASDSKEFAPDSKESTHEGRQSSTVGGSRERLELPLTLHGAIQSLGTRPRRERLWPVIADLCAARPWRPGDLARVLDLTNPTMLVHRHLSPMVEAGLLERTHPNTPNHPDQAYRTPVPRSSS